MKNGAKCPKCGGTHSIRISDNPYRYASGNNIYTTRATLLGKVPVIRYVCYDCGYVENWVENRRSGKNCGAPLDREKYINAGKAPYPETAGERS